MRVALTAFEGEKDRRHEDTDDNGNDRDGVKKDDNYDEDEDDDKDTVMKDGDYDEDDDNDMNMIWI